MTDPLDMIINVYKPVGLTSYDVVRRVKRLSRIKKVGHGGTLDPFAEGVLLILLGRATKRMSEIQTFFKSYEADLRLGAATPTGDPTAEPDRFATIPDVTKIDWPAVAAAFRGILEQTPPQYSAKKVAGRPAYSYARKGIAVDLKPKTVEIETLDIAVADAQTLRLNVTCSSGTYIRVLAEEIAESVGSVGHLLRLKRTRIGEYHWEDAIACAALDETYFQEERISRLAEA